MFARDGTKPQRLFGEAAPLVQGRQACGQESGAECQTQRRGEDRVEGARRSLAGKPDVEQNQERGEEAKVQWELHAGARNPRRLVRVLPGQVDGAKELIRRGQLTITQNSAAQSYLVTLLKHVKLVIHS